MEFNTNQKYSLLSKMGYTGPSEGPAMEAFIQSNPGIAARMGKFSRALQKRVGMAEGGAVTGGYTIQRTDQGNYRIYDSSGRQVAGFDGQQREAAYAELARLNGTATTGGTTGGTAGGTTGDTTGATTGGTTGATGDTAGGTTGGTTGGTAGGTDTVAGTTGTDTVTGATGTDTLTGTTGTDTVTGATGTDTVAGAELSPGETLSQTIIQTPQALVEKADVATLSATDKTLVPEGTGQVSGKGLEAGTATVDKVEKADQVGPTPVATVDAVTAADKVQEATAGITPAQGEVSDESLVTAETLNPNKLAQLGLTAPQIRDITKVVNTGDLKVTQKQLADIATLASQGIELPEALAQTTKKDFTAVAATFESATPKAKAAEDYNLTPTEIAKIKTTEVEDAATADYIPTAEVAKSSFESDINAVRGRVGEEELVSARDIVGATAAVTAIAETMKALDKAAVAAAAQGTFSQEMLAKAAIGEVSPEATIQGQMTQLMDQFKNGTPTWAAGAMRAANAAMAARGLGGSSMAAAAIVQATMESALPIASQDAQTFQQMNLNNLNNKQQVSLANAAAQQNITLANLSNQQQAALQNSANAFALQSQNLSNQQAVVLANAQMKSALQGQVLDIKTQTAMTNAARYAEMNKINLTNEQQTRIQNSSQNLQVNLANLSNRQQTALANLQVRAALAGQELSNEQQMAVLASTQAFEAAGIDANNKQQAFLQDAASKAAMEGKVLDNRQQTALFNVSNVIQERGLELTNEQQTRLFNTSNALQIEVQNLSNRQQTALANAQIEATLRGQELSNAQQVNIVNAARIGEIANINFTADQQRALENAKLAQTVKLANLDSKSAKVLSDAAALSALDMANLNNRQQAAVQNAQAFLQTDLTNLSNEQQVEMFRAQSNIQALLTDQAAKNAARQFNASSENQTNQFFADLASRVSMFNTEQKNAMNQFNAGEKNVTKRFNAQMEAQRRQFNATNSLVIAQANAQWRQNVMTLNTAAQNDANMEFAKTSNALTARALDEIWQKERDIMSFVFSSSESDKDRALELLLADKRDDLVKWQEQKAEEGARVSALIKLLLGGW